MKSSQPNSRLRVLLLCLMLSLVIMPSAGQARGKSLAQLRNLSADGNSEAQNLLAVKYFQGDEVPQNNSQAAALFTLAAEQGEKKAQFNLGYMYQHGLGLPQNYTMACVWYKSAATQGHSGARQALNKLLQYMNADSLDELDRLHAEITGN